MTGAVSMTAIELANFLHRIHLIESPRELALLERSVQARPNGEAAIGTLLGIIALKQRRLLAAN